jgi:hypothetical protein
MVPLAMCPGLRVQGTAANSNREAGACGHTSAMVTHKHPDVEELANLKPNPCPKTSLCLDRRCIFRTFL